MLRKVYTLNFGREFHGAYPTAEAANRSYERAVDAAMARLPGLAPDEAARLIGHPIIELRRLSKAEFCNLIQDDVSDENWGRFSL